MNKYPVNANGIAVPTEELELPPSQLDLTNPYNFNTHHRQFYRRWYGRTALGQCLRDLDRLQGPLPKDVHQWLHDNNDPPEFPTEYQMAAEIMSAEEELESVRIYNIEQKRYELYPIPFSIIQEIRRDWGDYDKPRSIIT